MSTFIHQVGGRSSFSHYGHQIALEEGDFTLCNNSAPYELNLLGASELIMFRVPTPLVRETIPSHEGHCGRLLRRDESLVSTAAAMLQDLARKEPSRLAPETGERAGRHVLDVLASSYLSLPEQEGSGSAVMLGRFWKVKLFIEEQLRNPELSPSYVARHLRISDRYLRMIFEVAEETPSSYILRRRLEECAAQLRDPRWRQASITEIAFGWGFNSAPHFARRFRARFLCSPRDYRSQLAA
jgi:AraC-like DNA-binding protein